MAKKKKIDWLNHFLEFIVVVIGILLAFQLNTCSQAKKEGELVDRHIESIIDETVYNQNNVKRSLKSSNAMLALVDTLAVVVNDKQRLKDEYWLSFKLLAADYLYIKKNAYNTLMATGDVRFIENPVLQNDIVGIYEYYGWAEGVDEQSRSTMTEYYYPYLIDYSNMTSDTLENPAPYETQKFKNILASYGYALRERIKKQEDLDNVIQEFLEKYKKN